MSYVHAVLHSAEPDSGAGTAASPYCRRSPLPAAPPPDNVAGTIIFVPDPCVVDFMGEKSTGSKGLKSPRVLLVSTWCSSRWEFPGGGIIGKETLTEAMNREWAEETGDVTGIVRFTAEDHWFTNQGTRCAVFIKIVKDLDVFTQVLQGFFRSPRYPDEMHGISGMPLFVEGPVPPLTDRQPDIFGIPRFIVQGAFNHNKQTKHNLMAALVAAGIIDRAQCDRIVWLASMLLRDGRGDGVLNVRQIMQMALQRSESGGCCSS